MSKFFKALEQAERERGLREQAQQQEANPTGPVSRAPAASREDPTPARAPAAAEPPSGSPVAETAFYQSLACAIRGVISRGIRKLLITSSGPGEGKSTIVANLGRALAESGNESIVLVDADRFKPSLHRIFRLGNSGGVGEILKEVYEVEINKEDSRGFGTGDWLELLRVQGKTGRLLVAANDQEFSLLFHKGRICSIFWRQRPEDGRLASLLVRAGRITQAQKEAALQSQEESHQPLGEVLCALGYVEPADLEPPLQLQFKECLHKMLTLPEPKVLFSPAPMPESQPDILSRPVLNGFRSQDSRYYSKQPFLLARITTYLRNSENDNLKILTSGSTAFDLHERSTAEQFRALSDALARRFDLVLVDSPPVALTSPAATLATLVDAVILVVKSDGFDVRVIQHAKDQLQKAGANLLGVILNRVDVRQDKLFSHYYSESSRK